MCTQGLNLLHMGGGGLDDAYRVSDVRHSGGEVSDFTCIQGLYFFNFLHI